MPIDFNAAWKKLQRFPRPHLAPAGPADPAAPRAPAAPAASAAITQHELTLMNTVTSGDHSKSARIRAVELQTKKDHLPSRLTSVHKDTLYFISTDPSVHEGKLCVGLASAAEDVTDGAPSTKVSVRWFIRSKWKTVNQFQWDPTSSFEKAGDPNHPTKQLETKKPLSSFLPLPVRLNLSASLQKHRIAAPCTRLLELMCEERRLIHADPAKADTAEVSGGDPTFSLVSAYASLILPPS